MRQGRSDSAKRKRQQSVADYDPIQEVLRLDLEQYPPPPPPPPRASPLRQAQLIAQQLFPMLMASAVGFSDLQAEGFFRYLVWMLKEAGSPRDPLEQILLCQTALAHFRVGVLHTSAAVATDRDAVEVYANAATRLTGELRRLVLTVAEYRKLSTTTTHAESVEDPIRYPVETPLSTPASASEVGKAKTVQVGEGEKHCDASKKASNADDRPSSRSTAKPTTRGSRSEKSSGTWASHGGGTRTPAPVRPARSTLGEGHRTTDAGRKSKGSSKRRQEAERAEVPAEAVVGVG